MDRTIPAIFASGVFRPLEPVDLAEGTQVEIQVPLATNGSANGWPPGYFDETAGKLAGEDFERPAQGDLPSREGW